LPKNLFAEFLFAEKYRFNFAEILFAEIFICRNFHLPKYLFAELRQMQFGWSQTSSFTTQGPML
jgi:hypothetical protein